MKTFLRNLRRWLAGKIVITSVTEAEMRVYVAAPELLQALREITACDPFRAITMHDIAKAAIAKATNGEPNA